MYTAKIRLYVEHDLAGGASFEATPDQMHYLAGVMRLAPGDGVMLFNGRDGEWRAEITEATRKSCRFAVRHRERGQTDEAGPWLLFAPVKRNGTDLIVEKATELGVGRLQPVTTEYTNTARIKPERLRAIAIEAAEQCGRLTLPEIGELKPLAAAISELPADRTLYHMDETGGGGAISEVMAPGAIGALLTGPEGGFSPSELDLLRNLPNSKSISLGSRILRAETAALAALACWQALAGDWR